jgi:hypothetical protein
MEVNAPKLYGGDGRVWSEGGSQTLNLCKSMSSITHRHLRES